MWISACFKNLQLTLVFNSGGYVTVISSWLSKANVNPAINTTSSRTYQQTLHPTTQAQDLSPTATKTPHSKDLPQESRRHPLRTSQFRLSQLQAESGEKEYVILAEGETLLLRTLRVVEAWAVFCLSGWWRNDDGGRRSQLKEPTRSRGPTNWALCKCADQIRFLC